MSWWPFGRKRVASPPDGFTRALTWHSEQAAIGALLAAPETTAAAETAAGLLSRSLSVAEVSPSNNLTACITPSFLARVGSDLIRCGEHLSVIDVDDGMITLKPASAWTVIEGSTDPDSWIVRAEIPKPHGTQQIITRWDGVICSHWSTSPREPWQGIGPLTGSALTSALLAHSERSLGLEQSGPIGGLLAIPADADTELAPTTNQISELDGQIGVVPSIAGGLGGGTDAGPQREWQVNRLGPMPPAPSVTLCREAAHAVLAACGVPIELVAGGGGSAASREAYRRFERTTVAPIAHCLASELSTKLEIEVRLDLGAMAASDMAGRGRAFKIFAEHGYSPAQAAEILRLPPPAQAPQTALTGPETGASDAGR